MTATAGGCLRLTPLHARRGAGRARTRRLAPTAIGAWVVPRAHLAWTTRASDPGPISLLTLCRPGRTVNPARSVCSAHSDRLCLASTVGLAMAWQHTSRTHTSSASVRPAGMSRYGLDHSIPPCVGDQVRLGLPQAAAPAEGPPRTRACRMDQSREAHHSARPHHSPRGLTSGDPPSSR
jgi:hypothetical protein